MCGIVGIVRPGCSIRMEEIHRFTDAVAHRGPDDAGVWLQNVIALGHRRLSIIDIEHGQQPMSSDDGSICLTYNGELYNFKELGSELRTLGHRFRTRSDTEVIIHAYQEWGIECVKKFRGMFAFGLADLNLKRLFLSRDHFGIKPLYFRVTPESFTFASEIRALRVLETSSPAGSLTAVDQFLTFQVIPSPLTIYRDTFKLPPAHYMSVDFDCRIEEPTRYWHLSERPKLNLSDAEWGERFGAAIKESVKAHLVADVPFGVQLSGGNDSTSIAWALSELTDQAHPAFTIGFPIKKYSEFEFAKHAANTLGFELISKMAGDDLLDILPKLVDHCGEPFGDSSILPTWLLSKTIREQVPMVLSGDGGDEALGGYGWYQHWVDPNHQYSKTQGVDWAVQRDRWEERVAFFNKQQRETLWRRDYRQCIDLRNGAIQEQLRWADKSDAVRFVQTMDYQTYLHDDILHKMDIASMYHGLEVRTPLVDIKIAELAASTPLDQRIRLEQGECTTKFPLKTLLSKRFNRSFTHRKKQGFCIPRGEWLKPGTPARDRANEIIFRSSLPLTEWFDPNELKESCDRDINDRGHLWLLLVLGLWLDANRDIHFS